MPRVTTYNPKKVTLALGNHIASGFADDSFIVIEPAGDGNSYVAGADGEVCVSVDPSSIYTVKVSVLQNSKTKLDKIADETGVTVNRMKGSFTQIAAFAKTTGMEQADALDIGNRVGHETEKITYRYAHLFPTVQNEMAEKLEIERMTKED